MWQPGHTPFPWACSPGSELAGRDTRASVVDRSGPAPRFYRCALSVSCRPEPSALPTTPSPSPLERTAGNQDAQAGPGGDSVAQGTQLTSSRVRPVLGERAVDVSVCVHVAHIVQDQAGV